MAKELNKILEETKKGTTEERIEVLSSIIEDMMQLVLSIPGIFDSIMNELGGKISNLELKLEQMEQVNKVQVDAKKEFLEQLSASTSTTQPQPPPPPPKTVEQKQTNEYKGANTKRMIMDELKVLFKKKEDIDNIAIQEKEKKENEKEEKEKNDIYKK